MPEAPRAYGEAEDGRVRVIVRAGMVEAITMEPRLLRLRPSRLGELVREAANAAIAGLLGEASAAAPDLAALARALHQVRDEALHQMDVIARSMAEAMARIRERTSVVGDPYPHGLADLLETTCRNLDEALTGVDGAAEPTHGEGVAGRGRVRVVVSDGWVESVEIHPQALAVGSYELAGQLCEAMNAAFDDLTRAKVRQGTAAVDLAEVAARARKTQSASIAQMHAATWALRDIMTSIQEPE
ncbi:hypothetical protein ACFQYP_35700 [Nonomuraea antimicrobica]